MSDSGFPKWLYHKTEGARIIKSSDEEKALGQGWADSPEKFNKLKADIETTELKRSRKAAK